MNTAQMLERIAAGEDTGHQFKRDFTSIDHLAVEIAAFANSQGGSILVGIDDQGQIVGLTGGDVRRLNQWISNATTQKIEPPLFVQTTTLLVEQKTILIIAVPRGSHKPYSVNKGDFWVKNGADKRRATREELFRLMQASTRLYADEMPTGTLLEEFDWLWFGQFFRSAYGEDVGDSEIERETLLTNLKLAQDGRLTLAGLLLFGKAPTRQRPQFSIKATVYWTADEYRDKEDIGGNLFAQQRRGVDFILRNLHRYPNGHDFNAPGEPEIPVPAIREVVANALAHRDYFIDAPIAISLYDDRVEIVSPGVLPNTVTVENIKLGIHPERNPILLSFLAKDAEYGYTGRGSGIPRVLRLCREQDVPVTLTNDTDRNRFAVVFSRTKRSS